MSEYANNLKKLAKRSVTFACDAMRINSLIEELGLSEDGELPVKRTENGFLSDILSLEDFRDYFVSEGLSFERSCELAPDAFNAVIYYCRAMDFLETLKEAFKEEGLT